MPSEYEVLIKFLSKDHKQNTNPADAICRYQAETPHFRSRTDPRNARRTEYRFLIPDISNPAPPGSTNLYKVITLLPGMRYKIGLETGPNSAILFRVEVKDFFNTWISCQRPGTDIFDSFDMWAEEGQYVMRPVVEKSVVPAKVVDDFYRVGCFVHELLIWGERGCYVPEAGDMSWGEQA